MELLLAYLALGALVAIAQGDWRLGQLARTTLFWPVHLPQMARRDPSPPDPPALAAWEDRITRSLASLEQAIEAGRMLANETAGRQLLADTRRDLVAIARRHAELDAVLDGPDHDLASARAALAAAESERRAALETRVAHIERLHAARTSLASRLDLGMAEAMNLAARLHLARATNAPVQALHEHLGELSRAVQGVEEAESAGGAWELPLSPLPALQQPHSASLPPLPAKDRENPTAERAFSRLFADRLETGALVMTPTEPTPEAVVNDARKTTMGAVLALALVSLFYRVLVGGGLEQTAALFIGMPTLLALLVAQLPPAKSYTGTLLKVTTLLLLLSGVLLAEGLICILMAAPLFYLVAVAAGLALDLARTRRAGARAMLLAPLGLLSLEGVHSDLSAERSETVVVERTVAATPSEVAAALSARPAFSKTLPFGLRLGFPRPVRALGQGLEMGDRRVIHFAGGEGEPGDLLLEVTDAAPDRVVFAAVSDTSHIAHWMTWHSAEVTWTPVAPNETAVTWTLRYDRELDPVFWFAPTERQAVTLAAAYLLDCLLPPEVSRVAP